MSFYDCVFLNYQDYFIYITLHYELLIVHFLR